VGYYAAGERLAATETQALGVRTLEEYRCDALGRRVWVRRLTRCQPVSAIECVTPSVRRTVWDGTQELAEIQVYRVRFPGQGGGLTRPPSG
jgi:hypothetical protein